MDREKITRLREARRWNKRGLAERVHVSPSLVSEWERGTRGVTPANLERLADVFGVTVDYLLGRSDIPNPVAPPASRASNTWSRGRTRSIPVLGTIRAGFAILTEQNVVGREEVDAKIVGEDETDASYFFLRVSGDSMINARIADGDLVLIHEQPTVENGEIAAVMVGADEAVLKRVFWRNGAIVLVSDNSSYAPIVARPEDVRVIGKVKRVQFEPH